VMNMIRVNNDDEDEKEWDSKCFVCKRPGHLLCCEMCPHAAHIQCVGLKKSPEGEWHCEMSRQIVDRRTTRG